MATNLTNNHVQHITRVMQDILVNDLGIRSPTGEELAAFCFGPSALWTGNLHGDLRYWYVGLWNRQHDNGLGRILADNMQLADFIKFALYHYEHTPARAFDRIRSTGAV